MSDRLCFEHGLSVILNPKQKSRKPHSVYMAERYGNITKDELIKRDIDECILKTISSKSFYRNMYDVGYTFNFERKHPTISHPDFDRPRRLKTLGDNYTPEAINERILAHWLPQQPVIPEQDEPVKNYLYPLYSSGYRETYVAFIQVVSVVKERPNYNRELQKYLVEECQKLDRLIEQQNLICDNDIETDEDLLKFKAECENEISEITKARKQLRSKLITAQRHGETDKVIELKSDISLFSERLKFLRNNIKICERIETQKPIIDEKIDKLKSREQEREFKAQQQKQRYRGRGRY